MPTRRFGGLITPPEPLPEPEDEDEEFTPARERAAVPETAGPVPAVVSAATPEPPAQASDDAGPTVTAAGPTSPDTDKPRGPHGPLHQPARALRSADGDRVTSSAPAAPGRPTSAPTSMVPQPPWASTFGPWQHRCRGAT